MRIPIGNFGQSTPSQSRPVNTGNGFNPVTQAVGNLGKTIGAIGADIRQENLALARVKAGNAVLDRELQTKKIIEDGENYLREGKLTHDTFQDYLNSSFEKLEVPQIEGMDAVGMENYNLAIRKVDESARGMGVNVAERAKALEYKSQVDVALESFSKLASSPGSDPGKVNQQIDALDNAGRIAYGTEWALRKQNAKDSNWFNQANQKTIQAKDNIEALRQLEHDFSQEGGFYIDKLDANARNNLLKNAQSQRMQLESRMEFDAAKARSATAMSLEKFERQIASTIPIKPEAWAEAEARAAGTGLEKEMAALRESEAEVQDMVRKPIEQQIAYVQEKEAKIKQGGDLTDAANLTRLRSALNENVKQMQDAPLVFNQSRTGVPVEPIDFGQLGSDNAKRIFSDRVASIKATQEKYGDQVKMRPLLDQEVKAVASALDKMTPAQQGEFFGVIRNSIGDDKAYEAAMQQIAPDAPIKARAGAMVAAQKNLTLDSGMFSDTTVSSQQVANTLLMGESILNKTKTQRSEDGKVSSFPIPPDTNFKSEFASAVGDLYAGRPDVYESDMQAVKAYYVGKASEDGDVSGQVKTDRMRESIKAVLGNVVEVGQGKVLAPWGMDSNAFENLMDERITERLKQAGLDPSDKDDYTYLNLGKGNYAVTDGTNFVLDQDKMPIRFDINERKMLSDQVPVK